MEPTKNRFVVRLRHQKAIPQKLVPRIIYLKMQLKCNIYSIDSDLTSKNMIHFVLEVKMENQSNADNKSQLSNLVNQPMPENKNKLQFC